MLRLLASKNFINNQFLKAKADVKELAEQVTAEEKKIEKLIGRITDQYTKIFETPPTEKVILEWACDERLGRPLVVKTWIEAIEQCNQKINDLRNQIVEKNSNTVIPLQSSLNNVNGVLKTLLREAPKQSNGEVWVGETGSLKRSR